MMVLPTNRNSKDIMHLIQPDSVGAEIGVWMGNTSKLFVKRGVKELHLVDPWSVEPYKDEPESGKYERYIERYYQLTGGKTEKHFVDFYNKVYQEVVEKFKDKPFVHIHRMTSDEWFDKQPTDSLDWIYIDGDHYHEGVIKDLENSLRVVKSGGMMLGDDYAWHGKHGKPGVNSGVDEFVSKHGLELVKEGSVNQFKIVVP